MQVHKDNPRVMLVLPILSSTQMHPLWEHSGLSILFGLLGFDRNPSPSVK